MQRLADNIIALHGRDSSLVIELCPDAGPLWRYWGPRLSDGFGSGPLLAETRQTPSFSLDHPVAMSVFPGFGMGWFGQSALLAHREGRDFVFEAAEWTVSGDPGKGAITLQAKDGHSAIAVAVAIALDQDNDVLTISSSVTNLDDAPLDVGWLAAASLPLPDDAQKVHYQTGRHNAEYSAQTDILGRATWMRENRRGLTSHDALPGALVESGGATFGAQLAWSGNHKQTIEWLDDGRYQWQMGEWFAPGEVTLAPGETLTTPDVLATCSPAGKGDVARNFHSSIRKIIDWPGGKMSPRLVHINTWEGFYFDHDETKLIALADASAALGVERFVLDDGWFHGRNDDNSSLGDWWVDAAKYPKGLKPLADHVTGIGMEFGLWVEPEMVNPDSELFRQHPDWALQIAGRPLKTARNQLVLDLTRGEVGDYLFGRISKLLEDLPISYLKWDHNRDLVGAADVQGRAAYRRQVLAAYALFDRFRAAFPDVEIEACAGGGGRIDAGIIRRTHRFWTSDCIDAVSRLHIQPGFLQYMPPEVMGSHVGTAPAHSTGRSQALDFRAAIACQGHFGVEFNLLEMEKAERDRLALWIGFYKANRALLHGEIWSGEGTDSLSWHAAGNAGERLLFVYREKPMQLRHMAPIRLPFVDESARYAIIVDGPDGGSHASHYDGSWLKHSGLPVPHMKAEEAIIFRIIRQ